MHAEHNGGSTVQKATVWKVGSAGRGGLMYEYGTRFHNYSILEQLVLMEMISTGEMISTELTISTGEMVIYFALTLERLINHTYVIALCQELVWFVHEE